MKTLGYFLLAVVIVLLCSIRTEARDLSIVNGDSKFTSGDLQSLTTTTSDRCAVNGNSIWVVVDGQGDCIRYYAANLQNVNPSVLMFFSGDWLTNQLEVTGSYDRSPNSLQQEVNQWSAAAGNRPYIFLARPGTFGSSGSHGDRRRPREGKLVTAALDALKAKHNIGTFHMAGQSGGGGLVATMVNMRTDVGCAVIASGNVSVWMLTNLRNKTVDANNATDSYDPVAHVSEIRPGKDLRIIVLSSPRDMNVYYSTQLNYVEKLRLIGIQSTHVQIEGSGRQFHGLTPQARDYLNRCVSGGV